MLGAQKKGASHRVGIAINAQVIEAVEFDDAAQSAVPLFSALVPTGVFEHGGDHLTDPGLLADVMKPLVEILAKKKGGIHLSIPAPLLTLFEIPKLQSAETRMYLASEAEQYKGFDHTEAVVDFANLKNTGVANTQRVLCAALRKDTLQDYLRIFQRCKIKVDSIDVEPLNILRAMAGSGVLDSLVQQIGEAAYWGFISIEPQRVRIFLWQGNALCELREVPMDTTFLQTAEETSIVVLELLEEIERTIKLMTPSIWLTHHLPTAIQQALSSRLNIPVRDCFIGPGILVTEPTQTISAIGMAMKSTVAFPFPLNFAKLEKVGASKNQDSMPGFSQMGEGSSPSGKGDRFALPSTSGLLMKAGITSLLLMLVAWGGSLYYEGTLETKVKDLSVQKESLSGEVKGLSAQLQALQSEFNEQLQIIKLLKEAKARTGTYLDFLADLDQKTPKTVWIEKIRAGNNFSLEGKALDYESAVDFSRSLDRVPYASSVLINTLKENFIGPASVFHFKLNGKMVITPPAELAGTPGHPME